MTKTDQDFLPHHESTSLHSHKRDFLPHRPMCTSPPSACSTAATTTTTTTTATTSILQQHHRQRLSCPVFVDGHFPRVATRVSQKKRSSPLATRTSSDKLFVLELALILRQQQHLKFQNHEEIKFREWKPAAKVTRRKSSALCICSH